MDHTVTVEMVTRTLDEHPDLKAVYLVSPTYYGVAADVESIVKLAHERNVPVLVDEAWGPHFQLSPRLADRCDGGGRGSTRSIQRTKCWPGFHKPQCCTRKASGLKSSIVLKAVVKLFFVHVAEFGVARIVGRCAQANGDARPALLSRTIDIANDSRRRLNEIPGVYCFGEEMQRQAGRVRS